MCFARVSASYATTSGSTTSGWRQWKGYGNEKPLRPSGTTRGSGMDATARDERHLNDLLVRSGHHERVLELVAGSHTFRPVNVATAFSRLRSSLRRIPMSGGDSSPENRRKEIARAIIMEDDRYDALRNMLITSLPSFGPQELATTISALADIHAFAAHGRRPVIRLPEFDPGGFDSQLAVAIAESIKKNGASLSPKQTVMIVSGLRGLGRVADRVLDDDGWAAVARSVERNAVRNGEDKTYSTSTAKNHVTNRDFKKISSTSNRKASHSGFDCAQATTVSWSLFASEWRSARRQRVNPEPLAKARKLLTNETWAGLARRIVDGAASGQLSSVRLVAFAMHAFTRSAEMRDVLLTDMDDGERENALRALQNAVDFCALDLASSKNYDNTRNTKNKSTPNRLLVGWGPTPLRVAFGRAPSEWNAIAAGCAALGLQCADLFNAPPTRREAIVSGGDDVESVVGDGDGVQSDDVDTETETETDESVPPKFDVRNFLAPGGRLDIAALPPMPNKEGL